MKTARLAPFALAALLALSSAARPAAAQTAAAPTPATRSERVPVRLGETTVHLLVEDHGREGPAYLVLHDDEDTAAEVGRPFAAGCGGRYVEVQAQGERLVAFRLGGRAFRFDPNRVFTPAGRRATLAAHSAPAPEADLARALAAVEAFTEAVLARLDGRAVVALHNNTEGRYSAASYRPGAEYAADAAAVTVAGDPDDFYFVTERALYDALRATGFGAVLQQNATVTDDGSLSVWAGRAGVRYVNVEAQHGHARTQRRMLMALLPHLAPSAEQGTPAEQGAGAE